MFWKPLRDGLLGMAGQIYVLRIDCGFVQFVSVQVRKLFALDNTLLLNSIFATKF